MTDYDYFSGDPKRIWQDQISGKIKLDYGDFLGALGDLQTDPHWKEAFAEINDATGMPEFLQRLQNHFDLCRSPRNPDGSVSAYQHPSRTKPAETEKDKQAMLELMRRHLNTTAPAVSETYGDDDDGAVDLIKRMEIVWTDDHASISSDVLEHDELGIFTYIYEGMSEIEDFSEKPGIPTVMSCIREACYGLAASYELQRYLMQDFHTHKYDVDALYELQWVNGCDYRFHGDTCVVFDLQAHSAYKEAQK